MSDFEHYRAVIDMVVERARSFANEGEEVQPMVFFIPHNYTLRPIAVMYSPMGSADEKDILGEVIRQVIHKEGFNAVLLVSEAWGLLHDSDSSAEEMRRIAKARESIANHPNRIDTVMFNFQTQNEFWLAQVPFEKQGEARTFGEPEWLQPKSVEGRFVGFFDQAPTVKH